MDNNEALKRAREAKGMKAKNQIKETVTDREHRELSEKLDKAHEPMLVALGLSLLEAKKVLADFRRKDFFKLNEQEKEIKLAMMQINFLRTKLAHPLAKKDFTRLRPIDERLKELEIELETKMAKYLGKTNGSKNDGKDKENK